MKKGIFILSCLILITIGTIATIHSSYFEVTDVEVLGVQQLTRDDILQAVGPLEGQNIFLIPGREVVNGLLNLDRVKGVKLERKLPNTLVIQINERSTLGLFKDSNNRWVEVSGDGQVLKVYSDETLPRLPIIEGLTVRYTDGKVESDEELARFLKILTALFPMQSRMTKVSYDFQDIRISFDTKTVLYLGQAINVQKRIEIFTSLWEDVNFNLKKIEYIDLRYEGNPVIRLFD